MAAHELKRCWPPLTSFPATQPGPCNLLTNTPYQEVLPTSSTPTPHALTHQDLHQTSLTMPIVRTTAPAGFHPVLALSIVVLTLYFFFPDALVAAQDAAKDFLHPLTTGLPHIELDTITNHTSGIIATVSSTCRGVGHSLGSTGAAWVHTVQQVSWTDLMEDARTQWQWLKEWVLVLMHLIIKANETAVGRLMLIVSAISLINNLLVLVRTAVILARTAIFVICLIGTIMTSIVRLFARIVVFPCRLLGNGAAFIRRLF